MTRNWYARCAPVILILALTCPAGDLQGRPRLPLSGAWGDAALKLPGTLTLPKDKDGLRLERGVAVPPDWKGARVVVHLGHPLFAAEVFMNGASAGTIPASGGEVDVAPLLRWDGTDSLRLYFPREGGATVAADKWASKVVATLPEPQRSQVGALGGPETVYLERQNPDIQIRDVWYQTFTRSAARVEPLITVWAARPFQGVKAQVTLQGVPTANFELGDLPAGESTHAVDIPAKKLKWWSLRQPNLYRGQVTLLDADGKELDRSNPVEFGVREFWLQGQDYYLNNQKINLTLDCYNNATVEDGLTLTYSKHAANGVNLIHDLDFEATACDRDGLGLAAYGVGIGYNSPDLSDPPILAAYRLWVQAHLRKLRNHPSILFWALSTNCAGGDTFNPTTIGRSEHLNWSHTLATLSSFEHHRADPTRPVYHHSSAGTGDLDSGNIYFNHLSTQSVEDWLSAWKKRGDRPFMFIEFMGAPLLPDYLKGYTSPPMRSYATEYAARLAGPRAYAAETADYRDYATHAVPRLKSLWDYDPLPYSDLITEQLLQAFQRTYRACRYYGVPADAWIFPPPAKAKNAPAMANLNKLVKAAREVLKPDCCWIGGPAKEWTSKTHQYYPGETIAKSALIVHDQPAQTDVTVKWEARRDGALVASGEEKATLAPWSRTAIEFQFKAPETSGELEITATVNGLKGAGGCEPFRCSVWPRPEPGKGAFAVIDPEGETSAWLKRAGAEVTPFDPAKPRTLALGRRALRGMAKLPFTEKDIHDGLRVLVCEQHCGDLERLGFRTESHCPRNVFVRCPAHPAMAGLHDEALRDWRGSSTLLGWGPEGDTTHTPLSRRTYHWSNRGSVASNLVETPQFGAFKALSDCEFDLSYTPLLSWRHGKGEIVFSQLDLSGRTDSDPAAERLQRNLVNYFQTLLAQQSRQAVCASPATQDKIAGLGFAAQPWKDKLDPAADLLVFGKDDAAAWREHRGEAEAFAQSGGTVLFFPASAEMELTGLSLQPVRVVGNVAPVDANPLLDGVGPQHLHWREPVDLVKVEGPGVESLLGGLAGVLPQGQGRFVFLQTDPAAFANFAAVQADDTRLRKPGEQAILDSAYAKDRRRSLWQAKRLDALALSNLGLESSPELVKTLFHGKRKMPFYPVDKWMLLGPIPPRADPLALDLAALLRERAAEKPVAMGDDKAATWCAPIDFNNGLGVGGMVDLAKVYGVKERQASVAVTYLWSSRPRLATFEVGADWWLKVQLNGQEIFRTGSDVKSNMGGAFAKGFAFSVKAQLKQGWNEVVCAVGSGGSGNAFSFRVSNPGDVKEEQTLAPPKESPMIFLRFAAGGQFGKMSANELEESENAPTGFPLYADPLTVDDDPYLYMRW